MKKLFTILCAGLLSYGVSAQTDAGNILMGVNSNFSYTSTTPEEGDGTSTMELGASGGYFVMDNLAVLAMFDYSKDSEADDAATLFGIGGRYYMNGIYGQFAYIMGPKVGDLDQSRIRLGAGYVHMLTDNISLEPSLNYDMKSVDGESNGSDISLHVGFGLYF